MRSITRKNGRSLPDHVSLVLDCDKSHSDTNRMVDTYIAISGSIIDVNTFITNSMEAGSINNHKLVLLGYISWTYKRNVVNLKTDLYMCHRKLGGEDAGFRIGHDVVRAVWTQATGDWGDVVQWCILYGGELDGWRWSNSGRPNGVRGAWNICNCGDVQFAVGVHGRAFSDDGEEYSTWVHTASGADRGGGGADGGGDGAGAAVCGIWVVRDHRRGDVILPARDLQPALLYDTMAGMEHGQKAREGA